MRKLIGLLALLGALGVLAAAASTASAYEVTLADGSTVVIEHVGTAGPTIAGHVIPFAKSECSSGTVCMWSGSEFNGTFSQWAESSTGCHSHSGNPELRSGWNRNSTDKVEVGGSGIILAPGETFQITSGNPITGEICWPPR